MTQRMHDLQEQSKVQSHYDGRAEEAVREIHRLCARASKQCRLFDLSERLSAGHMNDISGHGRIIGEADLDCLYGDPGLFFETTKAKLMATVKERLLFSLSSCWDSLRRLRMRLRRCASARLISSGVSQIKLMRSSADNMLSDYSFIVRLGIKYYPCEV